MKRIEIKGLTLIANAAGDDAEKEADELLEAANEALRHLRPDLHPQLGREELFAKYVEAEDEAPTRKEFKVAAVSSNRNSFGLASMVVVARDGEAYRVLSNALYIKRAGEVLTVEPQGGGWNFSALGYEVPEKLAGAPPDVVIELFRNYEARVRLVAEERRRSEKRQQLVRLADELGYQVVERRAA